MLLIIITQVVACIAWSLLLHIFIFRLVVRLPLLYVCSECTCNKGDDNMFPSLVSCTDMSVDPS